MGQNDIKIGLNLDQSSYRTVENSLRSLINVVNQLNKSMEGLARNVGKISTGGVAGSGVRSYTAGAPGQRAGKKGGGIADSILGDVDNVAASGAKLVKMMDDVKRKHQEVTSSMRSGPGWSTGAIDSVGGGRDNRVNNAWAAFERNEGFSNPGSRIPLLNFDQAGGTSAAPSGAPTHNVPIPRTKGGGPTHNVPIPSTKGGDVGDVGDGLNWGTGWGQAGANLLSGNIAGLAAKAGVAGAVLYGGYKAAKALSNMSFQQEASEVDFGLHNPLRESQARAQVFSPIKTFNQAIISGNLARQFSTATMSSREQSFQKTGSYALWDSIFDSEKNKELTEIHMKKGSLEGTKADISAGVGKFGNTIFKVLSGNYKSSGPDIKESVGNMRPSYVPGIGYQPGTGVFAKNAVRTAPTDDARDIQRKQEDIERAPEQAARLEDAIQADMGKRSALGDYYLDQIGNNYMGRTKSLRAIGRRSGLMKLKDGTEVSAYEHYKAIGEATGYDYGDFGANYSQTLSLGKGLGKIFGLTNLVSSAQAGYGNYGSDVKTGGMAGGSVDAAKAFGKFTQGMIGSKGLDVSVANELFQNVAKQRLSDNMSFSTESLKGVSEMLAKFVYAGGADVSQQQRRALGFQQAEDVEKGYTSGSKAPYFNVASWSNALKATGGFDAGTVALKQLAGKDPALLASIAYGNEDVPAELKGLVSKEEARAYSEEQRKEPFRFAQLSMYEKRPELLKALKVIKANGDDPFALLDKSLQDKGLSGKLGTGKGQTALWDAATEAAKFMSGGANLGNVSMLVSQYDRVHADEFKRPKGHGAWAPGPGGDEAKMGAAQKTVYDALSRAHGNLQDEDRKKLDKELGKKTVDEVLKQLKLEAPSDNINNLADHFVKAAQDLANGIKSSKGGTRGTSPGK